MKTIDPSLDCVVVEQSIREARYPGHDPARWALPLVAEANAKGGGRWALVEVDASEAGNLWLPAHAGESCRGDRMPLAGGHGCQLEVARAWLASHAEAYAQANPSCWQRVVAARDSTWGPVVVAPFPVGDRTRPASVETGLIVIDGLHRALGWALRGDRDAPMRLFLAGARDSSQTPPPIPED